MQRLSQTIGCLFLIAIGAVGSSPAARLGGRPYRALLIVDRWSDPISFLVDHEKDYFPPVAALLKAWSVPFDVLRLDQQHLDSTYLFSRSGDVRYGVAIWLADAPSYANQEVASLEQAVHAGTSLLVVNSRFLDPALDRLLGLKFKQPYTATDPLLVTEVHFITRELAGQKMDRLDVSWDFDNRTWVEPQAAKLTDRNVVFHIFGNVCDHDAFDAGPGAQSICGHPSLQTPDMDRISPADLLPQLSVHGSFS